jgi:hypothetical protein
MRLLAGRVMGRTAQDGGPSLRASPLYEVLRIDTVRRTWPGPGRSGGSSGTYAGDATSWPGETSPGSPSAGIASERTLADCAPRPTESRCPDPSANIYLCFAALLHAELEGIEKGHELPESIERSLYNLSADERETRGIEILPIDLGEAIREAENSELVQ